MQQTQTQTQHRVLTDALVGVTYTCCRNIVAAQLPSSNLFPVPRCVASKTQLNWIGRLQLSDELWDRLGHLGWKMTEIVHDDQRHPCDLVEELAGADVLLTAHGFQVQCCRSTYSSRDRSKAMDPKSALLACLFCTFNSLKTPFPPPTPPSSRPFCLSSPFPATVNAVRFHAPGVSTVRGLPTQILPGGARPAVAKLGASLRFLRKPAAAALDVVALALERDMHGVVLVPLVRGKIRRHHRRGQRRSAHQLYA